MIRSVRASLAALAATAMIFGCTADQGTAPTPSVQADFMTAIETPLVFGAPLSFVQVALDTFEVQGTHEMNTVAWDADAYAIIDTTAADTLLVFPAASGNSA